MWGPCTVAGCDKTTLTPEDPDKLQGPEIGARVIHHNEDYPQWDGVEMRVKARSYVWAPEIHTGMNQHGYRRYDWTVVEYDSDNEGRSGSMVVDDEYLEVI